MFGLLARSALVIAVVSAAALMLMRLRDYDDSTVSAFFDSCTPMPCWQGIRPGETTTDDALDILGGHPWVDAITEVYAAPYPGSARTTLIYWTWSDRYPFAGSFPFLRQGVIVTNQGVVRQIYLTTSLTLGDMWLTLGSPDGGAVDYIFDTPHNLLIENTSLFTGAGVAATARLSTDCTIRYPNQWRTSVYMWLQDGASLGVENVAYPIYLNVMRTGYPRLRAAIC